jgi:hypothetical protein
MAEFGPPVPMYSRYVPIRFSSIHAILGADGPLDYALVQQAISERVAEDDHLDWKRELPSDGDEVARDVAALANSRGGVLVYGVAEDRHSGRAAAPMPVSLAEREQRRIRSWLGTRVSPLIAGIEFVPLSALEFGDSGFLVVSVPESPDAPHLISRDSSLGCPYRVGAQTFWMREWDLERAYRQRFERRSSDEAHLAQLIEHIRDHVDVEAGCWLVGAARPSVPVPATAASPSRADTVAVIEHALRRGVGLTPVSGRRAEVIRALDANALNPRVGLRRWVAATRTTPSPESLSDQVHLELHHDGTVALATKLEGWYREAVEGKHCVPDFIVTGFAIDMVSLIAAAAEATGLVGQTLLRVNLIRDDELPFALLAQDRGAGALSQPTWTRDVRRFVPVETVAPRSTDVEQLRGLAQFIATDVVSQFGYPGASLQW